MKFKLLLSLVLFPTLLFAQVDDLPMPHGNTGTALMCQRNDSAASFSSTDGDASYVACSSTGAILTSEVASVPGTGATNLGKAEDGAHTSGDVGIETLARVLTGSFAPSSSTNADYVTFNQDADGRMIVNAQGAAPGDTWSACTSSDITDTTNTSIKAANASARHYVTSISISNLDDTTATRVLINDGSTRLFQCPAAINGGGCTLSFPVPLRGTANTALNCQPITTGGTVQCCAVGYDSAN